MRQWVNCTTLVIGLFCAALCAQESLTNETVLKLVKAGIGEDTIVGMVNQQPGKYSLTADDIVALKTGGVSDKILAAMIVRTAGSNMPPVTSASPMVTPTPQIALQTPLILHDATPVRLR